MSSSQPTATIEIHVAISPTPSSFRKVQVLTHTIRRTAGALASAPIILTVGWEQAAESLEQEMPWLGKQGVELRWLEPAKFRVHPSYGATVERFLHDFKSDLVLMLAPETLLRHNLDSLLEACHVNQDFRAVVAHMSPLAMNALPPAWRPTHPLRGQGAWADYWPAKWKRSWSDFWAAAGMAPPRLEHEHALWSYVMSHADQRYCPPYFNLGVVAAPAALVREVGDIIYKLIEVSESVMPTPYPQQIAVALALAKLNLPSHALSLRYNFPNDPLLETLHPLEVKEARVLHMVQDHQDWLREDLFTNRSSMDSVLERPDLCNIDALFQEVVRPLMADIVSEADACGRRWRW